MEKNKKPEKIILVVDGYNLCDWLQVKCGGNRAFSLLELVDMNVLTLGQARIAVITKLVKKFPQADSVEIFLIFDSSHTGVEEAEGLSEKKEIKVAGRRLYLIFTQDADDAIFYLGFWSNALSEACDLKHFFIFVSRDRNLQAELAGINGHSINVWHPEKIFRDDKFIQVNFNSKKLFI